MMWCNCLVLTLSQRVTLNGTLTNVFGSGPLELHDVDYLPYGIKSNKKGHTRVCADKFVPA